MRIIFFGTPEYVIPVIEKLHRSFKEKNIDSAIVAVVTQRPKPVGRNKLVQFSAVDTWAHKKNIPIFFEPDDIIKNNIKADLGVLASYGKIISETVISSFPNGILNIHPSLLPKFRGASPVQASIACGEKVTGATIIKLDEELDHGPIISQFKEEISLEDTTFTLRNRLFEKSAEILATAIPAYISGKIKPKPQEHSSATFTRQIVKQDAYIPPEYLVSCFKGQSFKDKFEIPFIKDSKIRSTPANIHQFIRAMYPWPVAWTLVNLIADNKQQSAKRFKILKSHLEPTTTHNTPNTKHKLVLDEIQLEGKTPVTWRQFMQGYPQMSLN
jgi:methionyl-tRNA formyltransferase